MNYIKCIIKYLNHFVVLKPLSLEETIGFDVKASCSRRPVSHLSKPGDLTKEFYKRLFSFTGLFMD